MNWELPDVQAGLQRGKGTKDQTVNICWIIEKAKEFWKNNYYCFIDYAKTFDCVGHNKLGILQLLEMGIPDHFTCLLRNLYASQEATVRTGHGTTDWFKIGKKYNKVVYCHPAFFLTYAEYIMRNTRLDESQPGLKTDGRNINKLRWYHSRGKKWK